MRMTCDAPMSMQPTITSRIPMTTCAQPGSTNSGIVLRLRSSSLSSGTGSVVQNKLMTHVTYRDEVDRS